MKKTLISLTVFLLCNVASADDFAAVEAKLKAAMASDVRTEREIARDRNRMPVETLRFFGLRDDMRIIELIPGGFRCYRLPCDGECGQQRRKFHRV